MILLSHPTGNEYIRNATLALLEADRLAEFWTCVAWRPGSVFDRILPRDLRSQLARRSFPSLPRERVRSTPWRELGRFAAPSLGLASLTRHETGCFSVDAVYQSFDRRVARRVRRAAGIEAVYTGEDSALETFKAARETGRRRLYDLPIGYWRAGQRIYREEAEREPEWAPTLAGIQDSEAKLERKNAELALADSVIVASTFTRRTLELATDPPANVHVVPYGAPPVPHESPRAPSAGKLRVLFAGALGQRKGLSYLLAAMRRLAGVAELTLLGRKTSETCPPLDAALKVHRWIPSRPHPEVLDEMSRHDVLVFPSLFEGFGLVLLEAMSRGLPVITTEHTAGPDFVRHGVDGYIIPIRSADAIAEHLELLAADRGLLAEMKHAARATAACYTWADYRRQLRESVFGEPALHSASIG